ncbi:MAG: OmpW family protein [Epsilonproteobacteria bacterium]|nr:OmpW family protein [Campylobacterota bacterium]
MLGVPLLHAHDAGDIIVRLGAARMFTSEDSSSILIDKGGLAGTDIGGSASFSNDTQFGITTTYMITEQIGFEAMMTTPFRTKVAFHNTILSAANEPLGKIKQTSPTLNLVYYPFNPRQSFQPYVGAGIGYTWFSKDNMSAVGTSNGFANLRAENAWGKNVQIGFDYKLTDRLILNAQARYYTTDTTVYMDNVLLNIRMKSDMEIKSKIVMIGLGYRF